MPPDLHDRHKGARPDVDRLIEDLAAADERGGASWLLHYPPAGTHKPELVSFDSTLSGMATSIGRISAGSSVHIMLETPGFGISHFHALLALDSNREAGLNLVFADESRLPLGTTTRAGMVPVDNGPDSENPRDTGVSILQPVTPNEMAALGDLIVVLSDEGLEGSALIAGAVEQARPGETPRWELLGVVKTTLRHSLRSTAPARGVDRVLECVAAAGWVALENELRNSAGGMGS